jgi:hypothetical protein
MREGGDSKWFSISRLRIIFIWNERWCRVNEAKDIFCPQAYFFPPVYFVMPIFHLWIGNDLQYVKYKTQHYGLNFLNDKIWRYLLWAWDKDCCLGAWTKTLLKYVVWRPVLCFWNKTTLKYIRITKKKYSYNILL